MRSMTRCHRFLPRSDSIGDSIGASRACRKARNPNKFKARSFGFDSSPGSHLQKSALIAHDFFAFLSNWMVGFGTSVPDLTLPIARRAARLLSRIPM